MKTRTASKPSPSKKTAKSRTAVRGKYFNQLPKGTNLAVIDPALHAHFPDSASVNNALRALLSIREQVKAASTRPASMKRSSGSLNTIGIRNGCDVDQPRNLRRV
jgi:hypothetical protein